MKTVHGERYGMWLRAVLSALMVMVVFTATASAHPSFAGKFTLPFEVRWDRAVIPAGEYIIRMDATTDPAVATSITGEKTFFVRIPAIADGKTGSVSLLITNRGDEHRVRSLNLPELGKVVVFTPLTNSERELIARAGQAQTIPVILSKK